jgi:hypothetical protein
MIRALLWPLRVRNRFALAWWAFRNPDNLTMLRHELDYAAEYGARNGLAESHAAKIYHGSRCHWLARRFLDIPVRMKTP